MPKHRMPRRLVLILWPLIDKFLLSVYHIKPLKPDGSGILSFHLRRYKGPTKVLNDGCEVKTGDAIMELHLNNAWFKHRRESNLKPARSSREILDCSVQDLRFLAGQLASGMFGEIAALHGVTLLHVAARRLGFEVDELPDSLWNRGARFYMAGLMQVYHLRGEEVSGLREKPWQLKEVWLSRAALLTRYGPK
jgi:hypothetical protein